jgi:two-component system sensor histidine kinase HydH
VGAVTILLVIVVVLAIQNINREERYMSQILSEKGAALIKAFEAGARTGMMGMMWGGDQVQNLLEETARQSDILYLMVADRRGLILAHNDRARIGDYTTESILTTALHPGMQEQWRLTDDGSGQRAFEVYRYFNPLANAGFNRPGRRMTGRMRCWSNDWCSPANVGGTDQVIFVGLDVEPFEEARKEDIRNTMVISSVLLLLGFGGFLSLFWAHSYRTTKRSLQDTTAFADEVVTHLPVGLIATAADGKIAYFNSAAAKITDLKPEDARGKDPEEVLPSGLCGLKAFLEQGQLILEKEMECEFSGRNSVPLSVSAAQIVNEEGAFVGNVLILRDLGEVRRLQEEIHRKEKLAAIGSLAAGVAHEIRNPLSSIKGLAAYFGNKFEQGSEDKQAAEVMSQEVDRLNRVISELLDFARPSELNLKPADVNEVIEHSLRLVQQDSKAKNVEVRWSGSEDIPSVLLDPDRFSQSLLNLYLNAIQAMEQGGILSVRSSLGAHNDIEVEVADTGKGINHDDLDGIFDPYFTTKPSGTGLGLAIVHKIIEAHLGQIKVRSTPGKGTAFTISVPIQSGQHPEREANDRR